MSVREEEQRKNACPSRGLGLAAAAIGVGVGAALYYFFSKRPENPDGEGSTSQGWTCEQPQAFSNQSYCTDDSYTTISEYSTSDTSIHDDSFQLNSWLCNSSETTEDMDTASEDSVTFISVSEDDESESGGDDETESGGDDETEFGGDHDTEFSLTDTSLDMSNSEISLETGYITYLTTNSQESYVTVDSDMDTEWDVTYSSLGVPRDDSSGTSPLQRLYGHITNLISPRRLRINGCNDRERSWSLEECSICFEIMLKNQDLMSLPCTHNFHVGCIGPWLQEQQTCPVCRKAAE